MELAKTDEEAARKLAEMRKYQSEATLRSRQKMVADAEAGDPDAIARYEATLAKLSKEDYTLLEKLRDSHADESNMTNECQFKYGFTMGVLLMCEIFHSPFFPHTE